jgi:hypothetical protein
LVKDALSRNLTIREVALEMAASGKLHHIDEGHLVTREEIDAALKDLKRLTYGGIVGKD